MPKLYTSPFGVPWGGWRSYISSSGAVQSFSEENIVSETGSWTEADAFIGGKSYLRKEHGSRHFRRMIWSWSSRNPWFSKQSGCPRRNWMTWGSHGSQCSCCEDSSFPGGEKSRELFFFPLRQQELTEVMCSDKCCSKGGHNSRTQSHSRMAVKLCLIPFVVVVVVERGWGDQKRFAETVSQTPLKGSTVSVLCWAALSVHRHSRWRAGRYRTRLRLDRRDTKPLLSGWIENNINWEISAKFVIMSLSCFTLFNSSVYFSIIHCTMSEILFFFYSMCFCFLSFFRSLTLPQSLNVKPWQQRPFLHAYLRCTKQ